VSLRHFADDRDFLRELMKFENEAGHDDPRFTITNAPMYLKRALELFGGASFRKRGMEPTVAFCIREGVPLISRFAGIDTIRDCRDDVLASGSEEFRWFDTFPFEIGTLDTGHTKIWARVCRDDAKLHGQLAKSLGLTLSQLSILACMTVLIDVWPVPDAHKKHMFEVLRSFGLKLKARAVQAQELRARVSPTPRPSLRLNIDDVLGAVRSEDL